MTALPVPSAPEDDALDADPRAPSKSQRKRDMHALQALGAELVRLRRDQLQRIELPEELREAIEFARRVNPGIQVIQVSATSGQGMDEWLQWIEGGARETTAKKLAMVDALKRRVAELEAKLGAQ